MKETKTKKVVLVYYALLHYRQSLFDYLSDSDEIDFHIICGLVSQFPNSEYYEPNRPNISIVKNVFFKLFGNLFYIQYPIIRTILRESPDILILRGVNPQIISSLYAFIFMKIFKRKTKIFWWGHGTLGHQGWFGVSFRKYFYKFSHGVLLQGEKGIPILKEAGIDPEKLFLIGNNMNDSELGYLNESIKPKQMGDTINIIFTGRLIREKKVDLLQQAVRILLDQGYSVDCEIAGNGPEREKLLALNEALNLTNNVHFLGAKYGEDLKNHLRKADLMIIPDYAGLSLIHGLSYGIPFITSDDIATHGPEIEVLEAGQNGSVFATDNPQDLAEAIINWKNKLSEPNNISDFCIESIKKYTTKHVGNYILEVINR